jgi:hypothetical protein
MKYFIAAIFCLNYLISVGQDTALTNSKIFIGDLSIQFPGEIEKMDTAIITVYSSAENNSQFQVSFFKKSFEVRNANTLKKDYENFLGGYLKSMTTNGFNTIVIDSSIGGTTGKFVICTSETAFPFKYIYNYITLANGHFYVIGIFSTESALSIKSYKQFFSSIDFTATSIAENDIALYNKGFQLGQDMGYKIVYILGYISVPVLIVIIIYILFIKRRESI